MRIDSRSLLRFSSALAVLLSSATLAAPTRDTQPGDAPRQAAGAIVPADRTAVPAPAEEGAFRYGPIHAKDPEVRQAIKKLYRDQADLEKATESRLAELRAALAAETDPELRLGIQRDTIQAKKDLQLHTMELGLSIAQLNGDERRVAEFEAALDRLRNPDKYMPARLDPEVARERARQMGFEK
jgi:hypothetical protein